MARVKGGTLMWCSTCDAHYSADARFCEACGARLMRRCPQCGQASSPAATFCRACGHRIDDASPAGAVPRADAPRRYTPRHLAEKILAERRGLEGERKQVTVLFADIKGSTELIDGLDPEDAQRLLDGAVAVMMEAVHRYEGTVSRLLGDGLMALFGAPIAHEDHAARACFAALTLQEGMGRYARELFASQGLRMDARVGLNSGEVVVRLISDDLHMDYTAMGQTVHLASRLEHLAREGTTMLSAETLGLVEGYVHVRPLGRVLVRGLAQPVEVFELAGSGLARSRLQVAAARGLTDLVGRQAELDLLYGAIERAGAGSGQVVALVGEAGVGKSRLAWEVTHSHRTREWLVLESSSVSYGKATSYLPAIDLLKGYCRIEARDDHRTIRERLTGKLLALDEALRDAIIPLLALLGVPIDAEASAQHAAWAALDPDRRRRRTLDALQRLLLRESREQPVLVVFEDLHWVDSETQALLDGLIEGLPSTRILLLVNYRPEYRYEWGSKPYVAELRIDPLAPESADALLGPLLGDAPEIRPLRRLLVERTGGNPFFLEESVRTLVESGALVGERGAYRPSQSAALVQVPPTVRAVLAARIDRLPPTEKRLLQSAAVVGKDVPFSLLRAIADLDDAELHRALARLQAADFLYELSLFPDLELTFKHALTHEVAYGSLLHESRRALHGRIVDAIEQQAQVRVAEHVDRLAHHAVRGEVWGKALHYLRRAYARVMALSAQREAVAYADQSLIALEHLPDEPETMVAAIDVRFELRHALWAIGDFDRIREVLLEAGQLAETLGDRRRQGWAALYLCTSYYGLAEHDRAVAAGEDALACGADADDELLTILACINLGQAHAARTAYEAAIDLERRALRLLGEERQADRLGQGMVPSVLARVNLVRSLVELGRFDEAQSEAATMLRVAEEVGHLGSLAVACWMAGWPFVRRGDAARAIPLLERAVGLSEELGLPTYAHWSAPALGAAYTLAGRTDEAIALLERRIHADLESGIVSQHTLTVTLLGEALTLADRAQDALARASEARELADRRNEPGYRAYALRLQGEIRRQLDPHDTQAERSLTEALQLAHELGMRPLAARCHHGLGALSRRRGATDDAQAQWVAARTLYRELGMTAWLQQVEAEVTEADA